MTLESESWSQLTLHGDFSPTTFKAMFTSMMRSLLFTVFFGLTAGVAAQDISVARQWNEAQLLAIRNDFARPPVHARNLWHVSIAMYDAWAAYDDVSETYLLGNSVGNFTSSFDGIPEPDDLAAARDEAVSFAAYRVLKHRFQFSPGNTLISNHLDSLMNELGYDLGFTDTDYATGNPAALGNYIAGEVIAFGLNDGSNELAEYTNQFYLPVNEPLDMTQPGNPTMTDPNRWQPLQLPLFIDQAGNPFTEAPPFQSPEWGYVTPFALTDDDLIVYTRDGQQWPVYLDPGPPPLIDTLGPRENDELFRLGFSMVSVWQSHLDPSDGVLWDISPASIGNLEDLPTDMWEIHAFYDFFDGGDTGSGHAMNPVTGEPYEPQIVPRADYTRILAEYWADGPNSETPPGHWYNILNYVTDHPEFSPKWMGQGDVLDALEWDVKAYFTLGAGVHDAAVAAWSVKGWFDYVRPVSAIRFMADRGQNSDVNLPSYNPGGIPLIDGYIELVGEDDPLSGESNEHVGKIKLYTWRGPDFIEDPETDIAGVGWILAENWWPYQMPTFVTPPFAGYVSGHSTFSRAAAEVLTAITGDAFFPGGMGEFAAAQNEFLEFENGPSVDMTLQWATYRDASDQCSLSRIWGGIHPPADDIPGRIMGLKAGQKAFNKARTYFESGLPQVVNLTPSTNAVSGEMEGELFSLTLAFDREMDLSSSVNIVFTTNDPTVNSLTNLSQNWLTNDTLELSWEVINSGEELDPIAFSIGGAQDFEGNTMSETSYSQVFVVDMVPPEVGAITPQANVLNRTFIDQTFWFDIEFNEAMSLNGALNVNFTPESVNSLLTPAPQPGQWLTPFIWRAFFTVENAALEVESVDLNLSEATDKAGNFLVPITLPGGCLIDTRKPEITEFTVSPDYWELEGDFDEPIVISMLFDEPMETTTNPNISWSNNVSTFELDATQSEWLNEQSFVAVYTNPQVGAFQSAEVDFTISNAIDLAGNAIAPVLFENALQLDHINAVHDRRAPLPFEVYPNPVQSHAYFTVQFEQLTAGFWSLYAPDGRLIRHEEHPIGKRWGIATSDLSPGAYLLHIQSGDSNGNTRVMVLFD